MGKKPREQMKAKDVVSVTQSPLNPRRWALTLSCGHDIWVTGDHRPKIAMQYCQTCK